MSPYCESKIMRACMHEVCACECARVHIVFTCVRWNMLVHKMAPARLSFTHWIALHTHIHTHAHTHTHTHTHTRTRTHTHTHTHTCRQEQTYTPTNTHKVWVETWSDIWLTGIRIENPIREGGVVGWWIIRATVKTVWCYVSGHDMNVKGQRQRVPRMRIRWPRMCEYHFSYMRVCVPILPLARRARLTCALALGLDTTTCSWFEHDLIIRTFISYLTAGI